MSNFYFLNNVFQDPTDNLTTISEEIVLSVELCYSRNTIFSVLRSLLPTTEVSPTKVVDVKPDSYSDRHIHSREDCLVLYEPQHQTDSNRKSDKFKYDIVLHRPCS